MRFTMPLQVVILAAGQGKRMHSHLPKVLHHLAGKPLLEYVIQTALTLEPDLSPIIIYGCQGQAIKEAFSHFNLQWIEQKEQLGTGHALSQALPLIADTNQVIVLLGDVPLVSVATLKKLIHSAPPHAIGILTAQNAHPVGYGRIKRNQENNIIGVIEEKDATLAERTITEINPGIYLLPGQFLKKYLPLLKNNNAQAEYYLTDLIAFAAQEKMPIHSVQVETVEEILGINDHVQLAQLERFYQRQLAEKLMYAGVAIQDPNRLDIRGEAQIGRDVIIDVNVILEGHVVIGDECIIGANTILRNTVLGKRVEVRSHCTIEGAEIASDAVIGPFARIRPGTQLAEQVHIGNFVEVKNSAVGERTKINHLSYIGDSEIGNEVNIGAGTITCNYNGMHKHKTVIGDRVQVGSDSTLVAPVTIHDDAYIAAATTLRHDVPAGALVFNQRDEQIREGWVEKRKNSK